ncbi:MAG TPA: 16S rRNA (adenine(1518)-N(6)/adenine(1519)-N(6))-dimethyltransferase RsmA [Gammaproteobacteria bacterium]|jgi:16S rRNA (adenine1518-N6/adenine1519-N6)-dimethyltransferase|nr:16S rRNA (adenine(1518)-N(6)/adenine(1519)-N(6))-dimethyltransferase RsmA [Gammaproteobacteria bacterium]
MHIPRKRFGQHFLCDQSVIHRIVHAIAPSRGEHLIEIGPGQGAMTLPLMKQMHEMEVIELDRDLIDELSSRVQPFGRLQVHNQDVLTFDFTAARSDDRLLRVVGNLPYNISTPLIFHLLDHAAVIKDMVFMLQKEVADRLAAAPGSHAYGRLSVMVQYHCEATHLFDVAPSAFYPPPKVQSSIIRLRPYAKRPCVANDEKHFETLVKAAFATRRKTLRNNLKTMVPDELWTVLNIDPGLRAEVLPVSDFVRLSNALTEKE